MRHIVKKKMPQVKIPKINFKNWVYPGLLLLLSVIIISCIVTKTQQDKTEKVIERLSNPPTVSTKNISTEKIKLLLPSLRTYLLSNYPTRKSITSNDNGSVSNRWEDLSGNKNDFFWDREPKLSKHKGFRTKNFILEGPVNSFIGLNNTNEMTIVIRAATIQKQQVNTEVSTPTDIGEVIANANLSNKGKTDLMSINVPATIKENFNNLKTQLTSENQNQDTLKDILVNAGQIKTVLDTQPNKGKKTIRNPVSLVLYSKDGNALEVRLPNGVGNLEVDVNGLPTTNIQKMSSLEDAYYTIIYKNSNNGGRITAYVNTTMVIDQDVSKISLDNDKKVILNPTGTLDVGLEEIAFLNRALNEKEVGYFLRSDIVLRTILDNTSEEYISDNTSEEYISDDTYVNPKGETCEEDCTIRCTKNKCVKECANRNKKSCPKVYKDSNGNYIVRGVSYGNDRRVAREIYRINYPNCRNIPEVLDDWYNKEIILEETCPFVVDSQFNPCKFYACENVTWDSKTPKQAGMNQRCRRRVDAYCEEHAYLDPFCYCWRSENYDLPQCVKFRSKFNNPRDRGCSAADFSIEENPDFDKYIRKDRIPCWGCSDLN